MPDKSAVEAIAGVLAAHELRYNIGNECTCGGWLDSGPGWRRVLHNWRDHLAAEIDKALGGLRRETANLAAYPADNVAMHDRWIGGWTPTEHGTEAPD